MDQWNAQVQHHCLECISALEELIHFHPILRLNIRDLYIVRHIVKKLCLNWTTSILGSFNMKRED